MFNFLKNFYKKRRPRGNNLETDDHPAKIFITIQDDGDFTIAMDFSRTDKALAKMVGTFLHHSSSGDLTEYYLQALDLWPKNEEQVEFTIDTVKHWKKAHDESELEPTASSLDSLAVNPSDVFGLRHTQP